MAEIQKRGSVAETVANIYLIHIYVILTMIAIYIFFLIIGSLGSMALFI